tara:strand:+ start:2309 stop:2554 length:246 start_codon:yes stop_codon:yes gene_type:complete
MGHAESAHVAIEAMADRIAELEAENKELRDKLQEGRSFQDLRVNVRDYLDWLEQTVLPNRSSEVSAMILDHHLTLLRNASA